MADDDGEFDVIVVGAGIMGSCAAYEVAKRGHSVILLEQYDFLHHCGSSHGGSRTIRVTYPEAYYSPMVVESWRLWEEAEAEAGYRVVKKTSHLDMGAADDESLQVLVSTSLCNSIPHQLLDPPQLADRFSGLFRLPEGSVGVCTDIGGIVKATKAVSMFQALAMKRGAVLRDQSEVKAIEREEEQGGISVLLESGGKIRGKRCVITAGAWTRSLVKRVAGVELPIETLHTTMYYWRIREGAENRFTPAGGFPTFARYGKPYIYGSPSAEFPGLIKISSHSGYTCDADNRSWATDWELAARELSPWIEATFPGLIHSDRPVVTQSCLYSMTPDGDFIIDFLGGPFGNLVIVAGGFSGHGFKMAPLIASILADLAAAGDSLRSDLRPFRISRFGVNNPNGNLKPFDYQVAFHMPPKLPT